MPLSPLLLAALQVRLCVSIFRASLSLPLPTPFSPFLAEAKATNLLINKSLLGESHMLSIASAGCCEEG